MTLDVPAIAVLPYGTKTNARLRGMPLDELIWPLGCPDHLIGGRVGDLTSRDHLISFPRTSMHYALDRGSKTNLSLMMGEPYVIHKRHYTLLRATYRRFYRIMTFNEDLVSRIPNGIFFPYGTTWVPDWRDVDRSKTRMMSLIASAKRDTEGHQLRRSLVEWVQGTGLDIDIMGRGYKPFDAKSDGLAPYRYSIVIENMREPNYFSEKLLDAVFCDTVPIYWGCPNLDRFMDTDGIIQCTTAEEVKAAIQSASPEDHANRLPKLQKLKPQLEQYCDIEKRGAEAIRATLR